jgi:methylglutaconyl-CoA hydratase
VIAAEGATFGFTEVRLGIVPAVISPFVVAKIGISYARAYFLSGKRFAAERALQMQLVHEVVPLKELDYACEMQMKEYLKAGPQATAYAKELIKQITELGPINCHEYTYELIAKLRVSEEGQEGMNALLEKRVPNWSRKE